MRFNNFKEVSSVPQENFNGLSDVLKVVSRMFQGCFMGISRIFQGCFKEVARVSQSVS